MGPDQTRGRGTRALAIVLAVVFLVALSGLVYLAVAPQPQTDPHTELYVLGPDGVAGGYPTNLSVGEAGTFIVGAANNEHQEMTYTLVVGADGTQHAERRFTINDGETWEENVTITFESPSTRRVEISLYRGGQVETDREPYREVWFDSEVDG